VRKGHRTRRAIGLALLFVLVVSLLGFEFLTRGASGLPGDQPGSSQLTTSTGHDQGEANGPAGGAAGASTHTFTHDVEGVHSLGASGSWDDDSRIGGDQRSSGTTGAGAGSGNLTGSGDVGPGGGSASGGSGTSNSHDPGSSNQPGGGAPFTSVWQSSSGGGSGGPFWGGSGTGGSGGSGGAGSGGTGGASGPSGFGGSGGAGGVRGPSGKFPETELVFTGADLGSGEGGDPANTGPIPTSVATVPGPPTIILVVAGVGMLWGTTKVRRVRHRDATFSIPCRIIKCAPAVER
jgi:hypothetical protein